MTKNAIKIKTYLEENIVEDETISELASKIGVSVSAITRYCQEQGYKGYKDAQILFKSHYDKTSNMNTLVNSLVNTENTIDKRKVKYIAEKITTAKEVVILGESFTYLQGKILESKLSRINIFAHERDIASEISLIIPKENTVFIFITNTGRNKNLKKIVNKLLKDKKEKMFIFAISASPKLVIKEYCNEYITAITLDNKEIPEIDLPSNSIVVIQYIIDLIFTYIFKKNEEKNRELLQDLRGEKD